MERKIQISPRSAINSSFESIGIYLRLILEGKKVEIPRTALAIFNAINMVFPEEVKKEGKNRGLELLGNLAPVLISANEYADIGVSAKLRRENGCLPNQEEGLLSLEKKTSSWLEKEIRNFNEKYGDDSREAKVVQALIGDFLILSQKRGDFSSDEWRKFVELDSAIYVAGCLSLVVPSVLDKVGMDFLKVCEGTEDIERKYSLFTISGGSVVCPMMESYSSVLTFSRIATLHFSEMNLKVRDDVVGYPLDKKLGIPNLWGYALHIAEKQSCSPREVIKRIKGEYEFLALTGGLPLFVTNFAEILCHSTSVLKAKTSSIGNCDDSVNSIGQSITTTLRHQLWRAGVIEKLFGSGDI